MDGWMCVYRLDSLTQSVVRSFGRLRFLVRVFRARVSLSLVPACLPYGGRRVVLHVVRASNARVVFLHKEAEKTREKESR